MNVRMFEISQNSVGTSSFELDVEINNKSDPRAHFEPSEITSVTLTGVTFLMRATLTKIVPHSPEQPHIG